MSVDVRPMAVDDIEAVGAVVQAANEAADRQAGREPESSTPAQEARFRAGTRRFIDEDGPGAWVATDEQGVVGMAEAVRRDNGAFWGLSMLFVHPRGQSTGIGRRLMSKVLEYAEGAVVRMIMASDDPRALRRYSAAGLAIHPAVQAQGPLDRTAIPTDLPGREGSAEDLDLVGWVDARLGRDRTDDAAFMLEHDGRIDVIDDGARRGFAMHREGRLAMLGATDDATAAALLWRVLATNTEKVDLYCLTAGQDWAVKVAHAGRLSVTPGGPLFTSGMQPPGPWVPSGWYF